MLGPLADNGGTTLTHLPLDGSPVIDTGAGVGRECYIDQRGFPKDVDVGEMTSGCSCDSGAVEAGSMELPDLEGHDSFGGGKN
jgi:hypothetical protein